MNLLSNGEVADAVVPYVTQVVELLSEPACRIIKPIVIDFNLIECLPSGTVFNLSKKCFGHVGKIIMSPRAYISVVKYW